MAGMNNHVGCFNRNEKSMKKRVYLLLVKIASIAILLSVILVSLIFYKGFEKQTFLDLETTAHLYAALDTDSISQAEEDSFLKNHIRVSIINPEGEVLYDNNALVGNMDNHAGREEIREALSDGTGKAIRRSDTMEKSLFYFAIKLKNGNVLRVAKETHNILSILYQSLPVLILMIVLLFALCLVVARYFTDKLVKPIEYLANNLDREQKTETYSELTPFMNMIYKQHEDILKAARMRQDFTANVSHELKTPLTSISGYSELIETGMANNEDTKRFAGEIHKNASRLLTLINDIIRLSELDATDISASFERINLYQVAENCVNMLRIHAEKHHVRLVFWGEESYVLSTKEMMEELLYNLCDNAIRYNNEEGEVYVSVKDTEQGVLLTVKDTGIGIPKEHQERIFERFYRVDKSRSKSTGGTGLGLAIVKHIVVQSNAEIKLTSESGKGTEIAIRFPKTELCGK